MEKDYLQIGSRFESYRELINNLNRYCAETNTKFWKRHIKSLKSVYGPTLPSSIKDKLVYFEIKFVCVKCGQRNSATESSNNEYETTDCPAYFRFKLSKEAMFLELIAMNDKHNHDLLSPVQDTEAFGKRKMKENVIEAEDEPAEKKNCKSSRDQVEIIELRFDEDYNTPINFTFRGLIAPTFAPFKEDLSLNLDIILDYAKFLAESGIMGVLVNGTSGEGMSMSINERKQITEEWVKAVEGTGQHLMVQVGGAPLPDVLELAKHADEQGVHSLLCLPDLYNRPKTSNELIRYLKIVAQAAPNTPLLYYHIPSYTNVNIHMGQFLNDSVGKIPNFHGIKFTSTALDEGIEAVKANDGKYGVFLGADQLMAGAYALGFDSAIATTLNIFPHLGIKILEETQASLIDVARSSQDILTNICSVITKHGAWVPTMKVAMNLFTPINVGFAREPLSNITQDEIEEMQEELQAFNL